MKKTLRALAIIVNYRASRVRCIIFLNTMRRYTCLFDVITLIYARNVYDSTLVDIPEISYLSIRVPSCVLADTLPNFHANNRRTNGGTNAEVRVTPREVYDAN